MHTGYQCKVNELEYGNLLLETCLVVDGETEIQLCNKMDPYITYVLICTGSLGYKYREQNM